MVYTVQSKRSCPHRIGSAIALPCDCIPLAVAFVICQPSSGTWPILWSTSARSVRMLVMNSVLLYMTQV